MFAGFDYGTSNCAIGVIYEDSTVKLLPIDEGQPFMPSALYAIERELICDLVGQSIGDESLRQSYIAQRGNQLGQARRVRLEEGISADEQSLFVGREAFEQYLALPEDGYFVKSPKSFLGASGLRPESMAFFEDLVTAMMMQVKQRAETSLGQSIEHTVIGRPVNFQGVDAEQSNRQALDILKVAAQRSGFRSVEFLYEPLAAGLDFEVRLNSEKTVLVVDVGGGTTDCSMVRMGPKQRQQLDRQHDFLGHSGERVGGNDLDIQLAGKALMPLFGMLSPLKSGLPTPRQAFWDAVSTNNVGAQSEFNSQRTRLHLQQLLVDTSEPNKIERFMLLREAKQNHQLVRSAELCKIALSDAEQAAVDLGYVEQDLYHDVTRTDFAEAIERPVAKIVELMSEAISQAGCQPDLIYVTGGTAKSPVIRSAIEQRLGHIDVVDGDHFGSVAAGLTVWAEKLFR